MLFLQAALTCGLLLQVRFEKYGEEYVINFKRMKQSNSKGVKRRVRVIKMPYRPKDSEEPSWVG